MAQQVLLIGGGNAVHVMAGMFASKGYRVNILTTWADEAERIDKASTESGGITVKYDQEPAFAGSPQCVSNDPSAVVPGTNVVILALPAFAHEGYLKTIEPYVEPGMIIGAFPGEGGFDTCVRDCLSEKADGCSIFALETLPWACRISQFGQEVEILGYKKDIDISVSPADNSELVVGTLQALIGPQPALHPVASFLAVTLMNINSVWHPTITYGRYRDWDGATPFPQPPLFYEGVDEFTGALLEQISDEILAVRDVITAAYPDIDLSGVMHVREWIARAYAGDISDESSLMSSINTNKGYKGLTHPMVAAPVAEGEEAGSAGYLPNFKYRYMSEDIPFGLLVTRGVAELAGVATPGIDQVVRWAQEQMGRQFLADDGTLTGSDMPLTRAPQRYGYKSLHGYLTGHHYTAVEANPAAEGN